MANGTIAFDTLQTSGQITGTAKSLDTDYVVNGSAKSWNSASNAAVTEESFNQGSGTDNGTGDYTYAFTNNMNTTTYCASGTVSQDNGEHFVIKARAAANYTVKTEDGDDGTTASDRANSSTIHGDLA